MIPEDFEYNPAQDLNLTPEEANRLSVEQYEKDAAENAADCSEELPPETRISATPIGNGLLNVINLDDADQPPIRRPLPPSDSDSDSDVQIIMKKPRREVSPRKQPLRFVQEFYTGKMFKIANPELPIYIAPDRSENEKTQRRIQQLQNYNQKLKNANISLFTKKSELEIQNARYRGQIQDLQAPRPPSRRQYIIERPKSPIEIAPGINSIDDQMEIENQALKRRIQQLQNDNQQKQRQIQHFQNEDQKNQRYIQNLRDYSDILQNKIDKLQDEMQIYKDYIVKYK